MSIGGLMRTSVSGMNAQANRLGSVSDNIANANTTGYKKSTTEFSTLVLDSSPGQYNSGVVQSQTRTLISQQGGLSYTSNANNSQAVDLAVSGKGYFVVGDGQGGSFLTRAGAFVKNGTGDLVNAAGYLLQGYPLPVDDTKGVLNGFAGLENVNLNSAQLRSKPTDKGHLAVNLPKDAAVVPTPQDGTGNAADAGTATQTNPFAVTGATTSVAGDRLKLNVSVNGVAKDVFVVSTTTNGLMGLTLTDVTSAINTAFGDTVAYSDGGKLRLTSNTTGTDSKVSMLAATALKADGTTAVTPATIAGLGVLAEDAGTADTRTKVGTLPSANNGASTKYTATDSMVVYDKAGKEVTLDVYMTKTGQNQWEYAVFDRSKASTGATAPFPYASGALSISTVTFDSKGTLLTPTDGIKLEVPGGEVMQLDLGGTSSKSSVYQPLAASVNGNPPGNVDKIVISADGIVSATFKSGEDVPLYKIPLAMVESPDNMKALSGNVYSAGLESGTVLVGFGGQSGLGEIVHGALEESTVDLASELTTMIESQRSYTANSKVFQTGSEIMDVLVNLKR